jgi:dTDP-4-dehydrorhamnose 3,5-epimerase
MSKFTFTRLSTPEVILVEPKIFEDHRGFFVETYNKKEFIEGGINEDFVQDNLSFSVKGVIRGMHFSLPPHETAKLVRCASGKILDVAVDVRLHSRTFGTWVSAVLSAENHKMLFVPKGFAHGFCVLSDTAHVAYKVTDYYRPENDFGISFKDPDIAIDWPVQNPILSEKDESLPSLKSFIEKFRQ